MKTVEELKAWQVGMDLVVEIYKLTKDFPQEERYGLTSQLRRAAVSIPANTAEGFSRFTYADKANKYTIARGECGEIKTLLHIVVRIGIVNREKVQKSMMLAEGTSKLLSGLISASKKQKSSTPKTPNTLVL